MNAEQLALVLGLTKESVGLRSNVRDGFLTAIIQGTHKQLTTEQGLALDLTNAYHLLFLVDLSAWRYVNRDSKDNIPRHLQFRLHNLIISNKVVKP